MKQTRADARAKKGGKWPPAPVGETLPTNLIQAQRDYFGAHTYERVDQEGFFHTEWS